MNRLAIFDIDGSLTDTNGVDDEAYRNAVASTLEVPPELIDWSGALHVTDAEIFRYLCSLHNRGEPTAELMARAKSQFADTLMATLDDEPHRFVEVAGAVGMLRRIAEAGWRVAVATGGWGLSARLKLRAAGIEIDDAVFASADDGGPRADIVKLATRRAESFYGTQFDRVVSIGDGVWDAEAAASLDLPFIGIANGAKAERLRDAGAESVFTDYRDIDAFLDALMNATVPRGVFR
jgi:phosphoglycolate phosphatase-like HAD superfamily hydrolase